MSANRGGLSEGRTAPVNCAKRREVFAEIQFILSVHNSQMNNACSGSTVTVFAAISLRQT